MLMGLWLTLADGGGLPGASWNLVADAQDMLQYPFMRHAFAAGALVALIAGVIGYFVVLRGMTFATHTLANVGFAGAAGAVLLGLDPIAGLLAFTLTGALAMAAFGRRLVGRDVAVGIVLAVALGLGFLFISLYHGYATNAYAILFGDVLGVSQQEVVVIAVIALIALPVMALIYRPLLFASLDEEVAETRGVPARLLSAIFLLLLALVVAVTAPIVGVLLIFALLVTPAATAERLTVRPARALLLTVALALLVTWGGIALAYYYPYPLGFFISSLAFACYLLARLGTHIGGGRHGKANVAPQMSAQRRGGESEPRLAETVGGNG